MELLTNIALGFFALLTVASAAVVVFHKRIIYSAFALLFTFFGVAALYLFLMADFLAAAQLLVYVGGILTLIIFGVFLTAKVTSLDIPQLTHQRYLALIPVLMIGVGLFVVILRTQWGATYMGSAPTARDLGELLMTRYLVPFELASFLLLAALIGAMRLARFYRSSAEDEISTPSDGRTK